jgi:hypothetical protein
MPSALFALMMSSRATNAGSAERNARSKTTLREPTTNATA